MNREPDSRVDRDDYDPIDRSFSVSEPDEDDEDDLFEDEEEVEEFSWIEYAAFLMVGVAMLWAWNMFMAASPYFHRRFVGSTWIRLHFQSAILSVSTITNLASVVVLQHMQEGASYTRRILISLLVNIGVFVLLSTSTMVWTGVSAGTYLAFLLVMVFGTSAACGLMQNGAFAYASGFGRPEYTQAIMVGQAVAGVLPCIAQIVTVLAFLEPEEAGNSVIDRLMRRGTKSIEATSEGSKSAFYYFMTATVICSITLVSFLLLLRRHAHHRSQKMMTTSFHSIQSFASSALIPRSDAKSVPMSVLFSKLRYISLAIFICFAVTIQFPVFTESILSVRPPSDGRIFEPEAFIPLAFLFWNTGDFFGRLSTMYTRLPSPKFLLLFSLARLIFPPLYLLCNLHDRGAKVDSDFFYLFGVQLGYGLSNGWLGSSAMMAAGNHVEVEEREAAGGFMGLMLVAGLTTGSVLSFFMGNI